MVNAGLITAERTAFVFRNTLQVYATSALVEESLVEPQFVALGFGYWLGYRHMLRACRGAETRGLYGAGRRLQGRFSSSA